MEWIAHRINTVKELKQLPQEFGVEIDVRDDGKRLIIEHDPFKKGEFLDAYLKCYRHGTLIFNIKSESLEWKVLELIKKFKIKKYFLLDSSFPMIMQLIKHGENNVAVRFSEFESIETVLKLKGHVKWVWVDCFTKFPLNVKDYKLLKRYGFKLCLVSPELQKRDQDVEKYAEIILANKMNFDAVCTKSYNFKRWQLKLEKQK